MANLNQIIALFCAHVKSTREGPAAASSRATHGAQLGFALSYRSVLAVPSLSCSRVSAFTRCTTQPSGQTYAGVQQGGHAVDGEYNEHTCLRLGASPNRAPEPWGLLSSDGHLPLDCTNKEDSDILVEVVMVVEAAENEAMLSKEGDSGMVLSLGLHHYGS